MNLKNWVVDNIQMIITLSVFLICTYSSIFVKHNQITYLLLSVISIQALIILSKNGIFSKNKSSTKQLLSNSTTTDNSKKDSTPKQQKWIWLKNDKPLYDLCNEMKAIKNFNQHIYNTICDKMNRVSKKYYKELMKDDKNLYMNLDKHKIPIQFIEDSMKEIIELFRCTTIEVVHDTRSPTFVKSGLYRILKTVEIVFVFFPYYSAIDNELNDLFIVGALL